MGKITKIFYCFGISSICITAWVIKFFIMAETLSWLGIVMILCLVISSTLIGVLCMDIARLHPADSHTLKSLLLQYFIFHLRKYLLIPRYRSFMKSTKCVNETQEKILMEILEKNGCTAYGQEYGFSRIKCKEDFVEIHPLTKYPHYEQYIDRICEGEKEVLTKDPVLFFALTSGTTGKNKQIPVNKQALLGFSKIYGKVFSDVIPDLNRIAAIRVRPKRRAICTKCGIPYDSMSHFLLSDIPYNVLPREVTEIDDEKVVVYLGALFCLKERELSVLDPVLSPMAYVFFKTIEDHADALCNDIEHGTISQHINLNVALRLSLQTYLTPDPARASEVRAELSHGIVGLAMRLWPHLRLAIMVVSGGFAPQFKYLNNTFLKGVFCKDLGIGATEGFYGIAFDRQEASPTRATQYTLLVDINFFEFIAEEDIEDPNPVTYFADQVLPGKSYEVVVTNKYGLYRYRIGDIIKVVDLFNQCPIFEFQYRIGQLLNLVFEKTPESLLYRAISMSEDAWAGATVHEYTATESVCLEGELASYIGLKERCYVLFLEVTKTGTPCRLTDAQKKIIDENLCDIFTNYKSLREKGSIGAMEVIQVKQGTFLKVRHMLNKEKQNQQFKTPRAIRKPEVLEQLVQSKVTALT